MVDRDQFAVLASSVGATDPAILFADNFNRPNSGTTSRFNVADFDRDLIRVYFQPSNVTGVENRPAILMFHGGNWTEGSMSQFYNFCDALAEMGFITATAHYRFGGVNNKRLSVADARRGAIWLEGKDADFGFADGRIILGGGSAGGHLATMAIPGP